MQTSKYDLERRLVWYRWALLGYVLFVVSGFYLIEFSSRRHSSLIRFGILIMLFIVIVEWLRARLVSSGEAKPRLDRKINRPFLLLGSSLFVLCGYFMLQSLILSDWDAARRILLIALFVFVLAYSLSASNFQLWPLASGIALLGLLFVPFYVYAFMQAGHDWLANPFRIASSGQAWYASYDNTIIAALFWAFLWLGMVWTYAISSSRLLKALLYLASGVILFAIYHTGARTAWLAVAVGLCVLFVCAAAHERRQLLWVLIPGLLAGILYPLLQLKIVVRDGLTYRDVVWLGHLQRLDGLKEWLFGLGLSAPVGQVLLPNKQTAIHPHSIYVETLYLGGLVGLILLLAVLASAMYCLFSERVQLAGKGFPGALLMGGAVAMFFDFSNAYGAPSLIWLWLWLPLALLLAAALHSGSQTGLRAS